MMSNQRTTGIGVPARARQYVILPTSNVDGPHVVFAPKGVYITGLRQNNNYGVGTWVRLLPNETWPKGEEKPTLLVGRVSERLKNAARIEMLALSPAIRSHLLNVEVIQNPDDLPNLTKRLVKSQYDVSKGAQSLMLPLSSRGDNMQGGEIYLACHFAKGDIRRLASQCSGLMKVDESYDMTDSTHLVRMDGEVPQNASFVLLDAPIVPGYQVKIDIYPLGNGLEQAVLKNVQKLLQSQIPGVKYISVETKPGRMTREQSALDLGNRRTDVLDIRMFSEHNKLTVMDQGLRVMDGRDIPYRVILEDNEKNADLMARALVIRGLEMIGHYGSAAWLAERTYARLTKPSQKAAVGPALAHAYHALERDDWALEVSLELAGYVKKMSGTDRTRMAVAAVAAATISGQGQEFQNLFDEVSKNLTVLPLPWGRLYAGVLLNAGDVTHVTEYYQAIRQRLQNLGGFFEEDRMTFCQLGSDGGDACEYGQSHAMSDFERLWYQCELVRHRKELSGMVDLAIHLDEIGAPWPAYKLWRDMAMAREGQPAEVIGVVWFNAAAYARRAQQLRVFLKMMSAYEQYHAMNQIKVDQEGLKEVISGWRALDWRAEMASLCVAHAKSLAQGSSVDLLSYAANLYRSIGDAKNVAIVHKMIADTLDASGDKSLAEKHRSISRLFETGNVGDNHAPE